MLDQLLSAELCFSSESATERNIKSAMTRVLGRMIKDNVLRRYSNLVLDEALNVHVTIYDGSDGSEFNITLYYDGQ
jgi:hypothetical protein